MPTLRSSLTRFATLSTLATAAFLAGCASGVKLDNDVPVETRTPTTSSSGMPGAGGATGAAGQSGVKTVDLGRNSATDALPKVVYFDFDSYVVKDEFKPVVEGYGRDLSANKAKHIAVEGHTDNRGGSEYNLALGQKRAEAVVKSLELMGATAGQLEAVSFGKERPAATGNDESAWSQNRRAELKVR